MVKCKLLFWELLKCLTIPIKSWYHMEIFMFFFNFILHVLPWYCKDIIFWDLTKIYKLLNLGTLSMSSYTKKNENNLMFMCMSKINFIILLSAFEIQVLSTLAIMCRGSFRIFQFALAICWQKNCQRPTVYYISNGFGIHWHIAKGYDLVF